MDVLDASLTDYLKYVLALVFVLSLIGIATVIARRAGFGLSTRIHGKNSRRLAIVESLNVDGKRKLVLFRRDKTEHLILLGSDSDLLIETVAAKKKNAFARVLTEAANSPPLTEAGKIPEPPA